LGEERRLRVFEKRVLKTTFRHKRDDVTGEWRTLHIEYLNDLYFSPYIIRVIKSRRMRLAGHVACRGGRRVAYRVMVGNMKVRDHLEDLGIDRSVVRLIFRKWDGGMDWIDLARVRYRWRAIERLGPQNAGNFLAS
jgi:hypothetical protein